MNIRGERLLRERKKIYQKSGSVPSHIKQEVEDDSSSGGKQRKVKRNRKVTSIWGDPRTKAGRMRFSEYLKKLKDASSLVKDERGIIFFKSMPRFTQKRIYRRLDEVDPQGKKELIRKMRALNRSKKVVERMAMKMVVKDDTVALEQTVDCAGTPRILKLMPLGGLAKVLALCVAAGHTREEVANMVKMEISEFNRLIPNDLVKEAAHDLPQAITHLANGIVFRDLLSGVLTNQTKEADQIVARRTKVAVDVSRETRERSKFTEELEEKREAELASRFGVDRKKGETIDANSKS